MPQEKPSLSLQAFGVSDKDEGTPSKLVKQKVKRCHSKNIPLPFSLSFLPSFLPSSTNNFVTNIQIIFLKPKKPHPNVIPNNDLHY